MPWKITALWSTGETRVIDFKKIIDPFKDRPNSSLGKLWNPEEFSKVKLNREAQTIYWDDLAVEKFRDGNTSLAPLDFCPDVLYSYSEPID